MPKRCWGLYKTLDPYAVKGKSPPVVAQTQALCKIMKIVWEYIVREGCLERFLELYSSSGRWVQLFQRYPGFIATELLRDTSNGWRFVTIDIWESQSAYAAMKEQSRADYQVLDKLGDALTLSENCLGTLEGDTSQSGRASGGGA